jgi:hypothetical protein
MPVPTLAEVLKQSGWTQAQIDALDANAQAGLTTYVSGVLTTAEQKEQAAKDAVTKAEADLAAAKAAQDAAELAQRANKEFYDQTIMPSLTGWEDKEKALQQEIANAKATAAFYEAQNKAAKEGGFIAADAPGFVAPAAAVVPPRDGNGKFVAGGPGGTPGSPQFIEEFENRLGNGLDNSVWALQEYQRLSGGQFLPDSISNLANEARAQKLPFKDYVARKYDFASKSAALQQKAEAEKADAIAKAAVAPYEEKLKAKDAEWQKKLEEQAKTISERGGNNPDVRRAAISNYPDVKKAVAEGTRKDPLSYANREERQKAMRDQIQADVAVNEEASAGAAA